MIRARAEHAYGPRPRLRVAILPTLSVIVGSVLTAWPGVVSSPVLPPLGFVMLLCWRIMRPDAWPLWAGIPLGLIDDLLSGQPLGSGVAIWTLVLLAFDAMDRRVPWRTFWLDWLVGSTALAFALGFGAVLARAGTPSHVLTLVAPQWLWSALLLPLAMQLVAALDRWRLRR